MHPLFEKRYYIEQVRMYVQPSEKKQWYRLGNLPVSWRVAYPDSHGQVSWGAMCVVGVG